MIGRKMASFDVPYHSTSVDGSQYAQINYGFTCRKVEVWVRGTTDEERRGPRALRPRDEGTLKGKRDRVTGDFKVGFLF